MKKILLILFACISLSMRSQTDTLLTLQQCESAFLKNNLELLAARYNVEASEAAVIQARIWDNPVFTANFNLYNPETKKYFNAGQQGQKEIDIQQIIYLGGKKHREVAYAKANAEASQLEFEDLLRNLKLQLRTNYFSIYFDNRALQALNQQINNLDTLIQSYKAQVSKGNLPLKDLVRLQSLFMDLKDQKAQLYQDAMESKANLTVLTGIQRNIISAPDSAEILIYNKTQLPALDSLKNLALTNRVDYKLSLKNAETSEWNLKWQKSLAVPDITIGASYDQMGTTFKNQAGVMVSVPLPFWNRNQGNIKIATARVNQAKAQTDILTLTIDNDVLIAFNKWQEALKNYQLLSPTTIENSKEVEKGILNNFHHGNVSLIEFTDFMESYNQLQMQNQRFAKTLINACEQINYVTNSKIF